VERRLSTDIYSGVLLVIHIVWPLLRGHNPHIDPTPCLYRYVLRYTISLTVISSQKSTEHYRSQPLSAPSSFRERHTFRLTKSSSPFNCFESTFEKIVGTLIAFSVSHEQSTRFHTKRHNRRNWSRLHVRWHWQAQKLVHDMNVLPMRDANITVDSQGMTWQSEGYEHFLGTSG
jgi:hypothetical protein